MENSFYYKYIVILPSKARKILNQSLDKNIYFLLNTYHMNFHNIIPTRKKNSIQFYIDIVQNSTKNDIKNIPQAAHKLNGTRNSFKNNEIN